MNCCLRCRQQIDKLRLDVNSMESRLSLLAAESKASAENQLMESRRVQAETAESLRLLRQKEAELAVRQQMIEPLIQSAEQDREAAKSLRRDAHNICAQAEARENAVLEAEVGLRAREAKANAALGEARELTAQYFATKSKLAADTKSLHQEKLVLIKERTRLHRCASELSNQMDLLKRGIYEVSRVQVLTSQQPSQRPSLRPQYEQTDGGMLYKRRGRPLPTGNISDNQSQQLLAVSSSSDELHELGEDEVIKLPQSLFAPLIREVEEASERLRIVSDELMLDPFQMASLMDKSSICDIGTILPSAENNDQMAKVNSLDSVKSIISDRRGNNYNGDKDWQVNDQICYQAFEYTGSLEVRSCVDNATMHLESLKKTATSLGLLS
jgi:hypothetical protein